MKPDIKHILDQLDTDYLINPALLPATIVNDRSAP